MQFANLTHTQHDIFNIDFDKTIEKGVFYLFIYFLFFFIFFNLFGVFDVVLTAHWEKWKDDQSISNMEAIDNKVYFFLVISLISIPFYCFIKINIKNVMLRMG